MNDELKTMVCLYDPTPHYSYCLRIMRDDGTVAEFPGETPDEAVRALFLRLEKAEAERDAALAKLAEAQKDTERLDWTHTFSAKVDWRVTEHGDLEWRVRRPDGRVGEIPVHLGKNLRAAIDAGMATVGVGGASP